MGKKTTSRAGEDEAGEDNLHVVAASGLFRDVLSFSIHQDRLMWSIVAVVIAIQAGTVKVVSTVDGDGVAAIVLFLGWFSPFSHGYWPSVIVRIHLQTESNLNGSVRFSRNALKPILQSYGI